MIIGETKTVEKKPSSPCAGDFNNYGGMSGVENSGGGLLHGYRSINPKELGNGNNKDFVVTMGRVDDKTSPNKVITANPAVR